MVFPCVVAVFYIMIAHLFYLITTTASALALCFRDLVKIMLEKCFLQHSSRQQSYSNRHESSCADQDTLMLNVMCQKWNEIPTPINFMVVTFGCKITGRNLGDFSFSSLGLSPALLLISSVQSFTCLCLPFTDYTVHDPHIQRC